MCQVSGAKYNSSNSSLPVPKSPSPQVSLPVSRSLCAMCQVSSTTLLTPLSQSPSPPVSSLPVSSLPVSQSLCAMCQVSGVKYNSSNSSLPVPKSPSLSPGLQVPQSLHLQFLINRFEVFRFDLGEPLSQVDFGIRSNLGIHKTSDRHQGEAHEVDIIVETNKWF